MSDKAIRILTVDTPKQLKEFIDFKHDLFEGDPNYVPELFIAQRDMLTVGKHPSHDHISFKLFLAYKDNKICGRIAAFHNENHIKFTSKQEGFFGFFDVIEDYEVAVALFKSSEEFLLSRNLNAVIGPVDLSTNEASGLLIDGFDGPPKIMMTYAKPYYQEFVDKYGFEKRMDLYAYWIEATKVPERILLLSDNIENRLQKKGITIRSINLKNYKSEVEKIKLVYNEAWDKNWGFVPMTTKEFDYTAKDMKLIMDKDFAFVAEKDDKIIGFTLTVPNINEVLIKIKKGRLLPSGIFKLLFGRKKITSLRVITLGVLENYRTRGIETVFYAKLVKKALEKGYRGGEASWILENNIMMNRALQNINSDLYKTYRLYYKKLQ